MRARLVREWWWPALLGGALLAWSFAVDSPAPLYVAAVVALLVTGGGMGAAYARAPGRPVSRWAVARGALIGVAVAVAMLLAAVAVERLVGT